MTLKNLKIQDTLQIHAGEKPSEFYLWIRIASRGKNMSECNTQTIKVTLHIAGMSPQFEYVKKLLS